MKLSDKILTKTYFAILMLAGISPVSAQEATPDHLDSVMKIMLVATLIIIAFVLWLAMIYSERNDNEGKLFKAPFVYFTRLLTKTTPIEKEQEILLSHDYDGIRELDNRIPPWFHLLFYGSIIWAIIYMFDFHVIGDGQVQSDEYKAEIKQAEIERNILVKTGAFLNEETVTLLRDPATLSEGQQIFMKNCSTCHGQKGEGLVGPNLTDDYWIHGGGIKNIFKTIKYGVPAKGMISWQTQLDPKKIQAVGSYIMSLHGTNPPNGKAPEGTKWEEPQETKQGT